MPLTLAVIREYEEFRGDIDGWCRSARKQLNPAGADDWPLIDDLVMRIRSVNSGLASAKFSEELNAQLAKLAPEADVLDELRRVAQASTEW
jgi:hypothetical protein